MNRSSEQFLLNITASDARKHQNGDHQYHKHTSQGPYGDTGPSEIPRPWPESIPDEKDADKDGDSKSDESGNCTYREQGTGSQRAAKDQKGQGDTDDGVEPHCVHRSTGMSVDPFGNM